MTWDRHVTVATGLFEIGLPAEALGELERIDHPADKLRPEIFALRLLIYLVLGNWTMPEPARSICEMAGRSGRIVELPWLRTSIGQKTSKPQ
jgi:hypothetical protein